MADVQGPPPQESETVPKEADSPHGNTAAVTTSTENPDHALVNSAHEAAQPAASKDYRGSIFQDARGALPAGFVSSIQQLEHLLEMPVWRLIQNGPQLGWDNIGPQVFKGFQGERNNIQDKKPVALLIDSGGGDAHFAYRIARFFQRRSSAFTVIIPQYAKSAATLMALGASRLILGRDAELGPLDVQMLDPDREDLGSALDAVQSLERLNAFVMTAVDQLVPLLYRRTGKKIETLLPLVLKYSVEFVRPLLDKIDTVDFTRKSRELKVAEEYAVRLMRQSYSKDSALSIARGLVEKFPTHGFVIDRSEAVRLGLKVEDSKPEVDAAVEKLIPFLDDITVIGTLKEVVT